MKDGSPIAPIPLREPHLVPGLHDLRAFAIERDEPRFIEFDSIDIDAVNELRLSVETRTGRRPAATASFKSFELLQPTSERPFDPNNCKGLSCTFGEDGGSIAVTDRFGLRFGTPPTSSFGLVFHFADDKVQGRRVVDGVTVVDPNGRAPTGRVRIAWL